MQGLPEEAQAKSCFEWSIQSVFFLLIKGVT